MSGESLAQLVRVRLAASDLPEGAQRCVLAAVAGEPVLKHALMSSSSEPVTPVVAGGSGGLLRSVWLRSVTVRGFRGVGDAATLAVEPGPGFTLVVGRNGSGKSSFAEGIEIALTGQNERLADKTADWRKQWRNIHEGTSAEITVEFQVDGVTRPLVVRRWWTGKNLSDAVSTVTWDGEQQRDLSELGWSTALEQYRPFLSYDDLGKVSGKPSEGFDLLVGVLGLEAITTAQYLLTQARTELSKTVSEPDEALPTVLRALSTVDDDRARCVVRALTADPPDVAEVRRVLGGASDAGGGDTHRAMVSRLASLPTVDAAMVSSASEELRAAAATVQGFKGTDVDHAARLADLLAAALAHHGSHGDALCPVCGQGTLDARWHERTAAEISRLRQRAADAIAARDRLSAALTRARALILPVPADLSGPGPEGIDRSAAASVWREWAALVRERDALVLAAALDRMAPVLTGSVDAVRGKAAEILRGIENAWRPAAARVQGWLDLRTCAEEAQAGYDDVSAALTWIKDQAEHLRDERLAPFSDHSARIWADLRQESNVDLGPIAFAGSGRTRRKLDVPVRIDGAAGGVPMLSNGELHALGLSLFLPRSTAPDSPFRFVIIDDPVQAMDPSKVEGLARVLHAAAAERQVIVLTHDDRLADALRRLMLPTTILEVTRREGSQVEIIANQDPVRRYLDDARQVAATGSLPDDLAAIAVTGSCRDAIEVACQRVARRRLRADAVPIAEVDERLLNARTTMHRAALALLGDSRRTAQVMPTLNRLAGARWAADVLRDVREGTHQPRSDLDRIIQDSGRLCDLILAIPVP
jgi:recombinational DNA repair ATPase RecF